MAVFFEEPGTMRYLTFAKGHERRHTSKFHGAPSGTK